MNKQQCDEWTNERKSPNPKNPLTNRKIKKDGPKYKELDKDCEKLVDMNKVCKKWLKTNHNDLYKKLKEKKKQRVPRSPSPIPRVLQKSPKASPAPKLKKSPKKTSPSPKASPAPKLNQNFTRLQ